MAENSINEKYVTAAQLQEFGWKNITPAKVTDLNNTLEKFNINTPVRIQHFLSQCAQETSKGKNITEYGGKAYFVNLYKDRSDLGNNGTDEDAVNYRGGGCIQLTGRYNYQKFADFTGDPKVMEGADYVAANYPWMAAGQWWDQNKMNNVCDSLEQSDPATAVEKVTRRVNGGRSDNPERAKKWDESLANRIEYFNQSSKIITTIPAQTQSQDQAQTMDNAHHVAPNVTGHSQGSQNMANSMNDNMEAKENRGVVAIKAGDTLGKIAKQYGITVEDIMKANPNILDANKIYSGEKIYLPQAQAQTQPQPNEALNSILHQKRINPSEPSLNNAQPSDPSDKLGTHLTVIPIRVMPGDTVEKIAKAYGTTPDKITDSNGNQVKVCSPDMVVNAQVRQGAYEYAVYTVQLGDNWDSISKRTGVPVDVLRASNPDVGEVYNPGTKLVFQPEAIIREDVNQSSSRGHSMGSQLDSVTRELKGSLEQNQFQPSLKDLEQYSTPKFMPDNDVDQSLLKRMVDMPIRGTSGEIMKPYNRGRIDGNDGINESKNIVAVKDLPRNPDSKSLFDAYAQEALDKSGQGWTAECNKIIVENMLKDGRTPQRIVDALKNSPEPVENAHYFVKDIRNSPEIQQVQQSMGMKR